MVQSAWGRWVVCAGLVLATAGCSEKRDLGTQCDLVRRNPDGGTEKVFVLNGEIRPGQEFISFGAAECEDLVCVRDADYVPTNTEPGAPAKGYCTASCTPQAEGAPLSNDPCATGSAADDAPGSPSKLSCRQVLLDEETLAAIRNSNPEMYERYFGTAQSSFFCARGDGKLGTADAGQ